MIRRYVRWSEVGACILDTQEDRVIVFDSWDLVTELLEQGDDWLRVAPFATLPVATARDLYSADRSIQPD
jgi:hypothetical protein